MNIPLKTSTEIVAWLIKHHISDYQLQPDPQYGFVVNVWEHVSLTYQNIDFLPVKFNRIEGDFNCGHNQIKNLEMAPQYVSGNFYCHDNQLVSLKGSPTRCKRFACYDNELTSLEGCPSDVAGTFSCKNNKIENLEFFPKQITDEVFCDENPMLGVAQRLDNFADLYEIHQKYVIEKEQNQLGRMMAAGEKVKKSKIHKI